MSRRVAPEVPREAVTPAPAPAAEHLRLDAAAEAERIIAVLREQVGELLKRRGLVVAMSGGVDSSVCAALAVRALEPRRVLGLSMPERDSDPASLELAAGWARRLGIEFLVEDISPILDACGCYRRRDDAIRGLVPEFAEGWRCKVVLPEDRLDRSRLNLSSLIVESPAGDRRTVRLSADAYRRIVAATNFKQRVRKMLEYHHADRLHYAVLGTPNRLEYDQGFFVKGGDGLADVKPIAHLYKSQVYQLAEFLGVPADVTARAPTTDTYSLPQSQDEFYFSLPTRAMDVALSGFDAGLPAVETAARLQLRPEQVERIYRDIAQKRATTRYLHFPPLLVEPVLDSASDGASDR
ncbi:MAG: NAD(+) synthase [Gemmatimonadota bacterium]|nr:NAD(+) synthase [Gemmatimonadota bacterium]